MALDKITTAIIADDAVTAAKIPAGAVGTTEIAASAVTAAKVAADVATQAELDAIPVFDDTGLRHDILTLALKQAVQEDSTKFNLPNSSVVQFQADADFNLAGSTTVGRSGAEYIFSGNWGSAALEDETADRQSTYTLTDTFASLLGLYGSSGTLAKMTDGSMGAIDAGGTEHYLHNVGNTANTGTHYMRWDLGSGNSYIFTGFKYWNQNNTSQYGGANAWKIQGSNDAVSWTDLETFTWTHHASNPTEHTWTNTVSHRYIQITPASTLTTSHATWQRQYVWRKASVVPNATGTALGTTNVPSSAVTKVSGVMLLKHAYGANTLGTDVKVYFTANNSAWTEASSYTDAGTFSTGIKMIKLGETTCTSGSDVRWKVVWANQSAASKEGHIYGIGLNY